MRTEEQGLSVRAEADWLGDGVGGHGREKRGSKTSDMCSWVKDGQSHIVGIEVLPTHCLAFERSFVNPFICKSSVKW